MYGQKYGRKLVKPLRIEKNRNGQKRNQSSTMLEDWEEFTLSILTTKNTKKFSKTKKTKKLERPVAPAILCETYPKASRKCVRGRRLHPRGLPKRFVSGWWNLMNLRDNTQNLLSLKTMKITLHVKELLRWPSTILWTSLFLCRKATKILDAKAAVDQEWKKFQTIPACQLEKVHSNKEVILEAQRDKKRRSTLQHWFTKTTSKTKT